MMAGTLQGGDEGACVGQLSGEIDLCDCASCSYGRASVSAESIEQLESIRRESAKQLIRQHAHVVRGELLRVAELLRSLGRDEEAGAASEMACQVRTFAKVDR